MKNKKQILILAIMMFVNSSLRASECFVECGEGRVSSKEKIHKTLLNIVFSTSRSYKNYAQTCHIYHPNYDLFATEHMDGTLVESFSDFPSNGRIIGKKLSDLQVEKQKKLKQNLKIKLALCNNVI